MPKIDYAELSQVANALNGVALRLDSSLSAVSDAANELNETSELDGTAWKNTKSYFDVYPTLSKGIWNSVVTTSETLTSYLSDFQSEVGAPRNQLDTDKLEEMQARLTAIQARRRDIISEMAKAEDYVLGNLANRLSGLDSSTSYFTEEIELLTKYRDFEAKHGNVFDDVKGTISDLKTGMRQISTQKHFTPTQGYAPRSYKKADWFNRLTDFNENQPEKRSVRFTVDWGRDKDVQLKVYKNGKYDKELTEKYVWLSMQESLKDMLNVAGEFSGAYDLYRVVLGRDPVTGESLTFGEWMQAGFWTVLEVLSAKKVLSLIENVRLGNKLLDGVSLTEKELKLFNKLNDVGDYKIVEKTGEMRNAKKNVQIVDEFEISFNRKSTHDAEEFARQLKDQQNGMNQLSIEEYMKNRQEYLSNGRSNSAAEFQKTARQEALAEKILDLRNQGLSRTDAKVKAEEWLKNQAALHNPDMVAGGYPWNIQGVGDANINSSLGAQWRYRINDLDKYIYEVSKDMTPEQLKNTYLNVKLIE
ncbi:polymorphic toxin type 15 domain-containing protein [Enterococcus sp. LJL51]|uniref:polymorphic toxin type 15 domain-containing protein n=1 Tax=Enterococcus sp. LJL51 TaxID=3416656 RepID=UPI003CF40233